MRVRWIVLFVLVAAVHFSSAAGMHLYVSSRCREAPAGSCETALSATGALSLPLLPVARRMTSGTMGWRRAIVVLSVNSALVGALLTGVVALAARGRERRVGS